MKKDQKFCFQHTDRLTFHRCFVCHKPICTDCRITKSHHFFCGNWCWYKYHVENFLKPVKNFLNKGRVFISPWTVVIIFVLILFWMTFSLRNLHTKLDKIQNKVLFTSSMTKENEKKPLEMKIISPVKTKGMVYRNSISITGEADDNSVVMLMAGEKLLYSVQPKDGKFSFENVKLSRGQNDFLVQMVTPTGERISLESLNFRYNSPTLNHLSRSLNRGNSSVPAISLTFDGGYLDNISHEILDILHDLNLKATFFLTGKYVKYFPETTRRIAAEGHEIGNHTMNHPHLTTFAENRKHDTNPQITREILQQELQEMSIVFSEVTGKKISNIWRAPYGEQNSDICSWAAELGFKQVGWTTGHGNAENMDTMDWIADSSHKSYLSANQVKEKIVNFAENGQNGAAGAIILMHLGSERNDDFPHQKLPEIVNYLRDKGYRFVTISEMIQETLN
jgi:peptidoglycan-N-acetylglucosamine deacetylase